MKILSIVEERLQKPKNWAKKIYRKKEDSWFTLDELLSMEIATDVLEDISVLYNE